MKKYLLLLMLIVPSQVFAQEQLKLPGVAMRDIINANSNIEQKTPEQNSNIKYEGVPKGGYITSASGDLKDWHLSMGPIGMPNMTLRIKKTEDNGAIIFSCEKNTGVEEMALLMKGIKGNIGSPKTLYLSIGAQSHILETSITGNAPDGTSILGVNGNAVLEILAAISSENDNNGIRIDDMHGHTINFKIPFMTDLKNRPFIICSQWKDQYEKEQQLLKTAKGTDIISLSGSLENK